MRRYIVALALLLAPVLLPVSVAAQDPFEQVCADGKVANSSVCSTTGDDPISGNNGIIIRVVAMLGWVVGFVSVLMILIAAIKYITASGDAASIKSARDTIIYALIGVAVFAVSQLIVRFILSRL